MYKCLQVNHENEAIIGFCFNSKCQCASQYCIKCLIELHQGHQSDCIGLLTIPDFINKYISYQSQQIKNSKDIYFRVEKKIVSKMKRMDENIQNLKILDQALQNEDYIKLKSSINIIKKYYIQEIQNEEDQFINQLKEIEKILELQEKKQYELQEAEILFQQAMQLTHQGKHQEALKIYDNSLSLLNIIDKIFTWKGQSLLSLQRLQEGIKCCDLAIQLNPKNDMAYNNKAWALHNLNRYKEAIECCDKAIQFNPLNDMAFNNKGWALSNLKQYHEATECYDKAIQLNSLNANAYNNKAYALHLIKEFQQAIEFYDKALSIKENPTFLKNKAESLLALGNKQEAKIIFEKALNAGYVDQEYIRRQLLIL
ncbi:unnamed protein product [Paramecium primaurelia]|uniref:Tetratricopeptide repeat protein n=1 Tax=Paramecium primaurelia TaxID=5886 RepID=A0A8S1PZV7_PARPR|nr:unnamed protein product [Paramecium primaurelia]